MRKKNIDVLINNELFYEDIFYNTNFYSRLKDDIKKDKKLLIHLLPRIWSWEDEDSLTEIKKIVKSNFGSDINFFKSVLQNEYEDGSCLILAQDNILDNKEILLLAVSAAKKHDRLGTTINVFAPNSLKRNQKFLAEVLEIYPKEFEFLGNYVSNKNIVLSVVKIDGNLLKYVIDKFKNDIDVIKTAMKSNLSAVQYVPSILKSKPESPFFIEWYEFKDGNIKL